MGVHLSSTDRTDKRIVEHIAFQFAIFTSGGFHEFVNLEPVLKAALQAGIV